MLFYRTSPDYRLAARGGIAARGGFLPGAASSATSSANIRATWMIKSFVTGVALLGLAYWLVQIAGAQYLATLTSATLLSFLLVYIVWCITVRRRYHPQSPDSVVTAESVSGTTVVERPPAPLNPALKHYGVPPRECSPPPSYEEVLRQMSAAAAAATTAASAATSTTPTLYEHTVATSSTAPCGNEAPSSTRTPPIARLSLEFPPSQSPSDGTRSSGSDTPSIGTPSLRTPSIETLSTCTPRLGMLSVGLSPERTSPVDTPPVETLSPEVPKTIEIPHIDGDHPSTSETTVEEKNAPSPSPQDGQEETTQASNKVELNSDVSSETIDGTVLHSTPKEVMTDETVSITMPPTETVGSSTSVEEEATTSTASQDVVHIV